MDIRPDQIISKLNERLENGELQRWLVNTWNAQRNAIKYDEIEEMLWIRDVRGNKLAEWQNDYAKWVEKAYQPEVLLAEAYIGKMLAERGLEVAEQDYLLAWASEHTGRLITRLTETQRQAVKNIIAYGIENELNVDEISRYIRPVIGLNRLQEKWVEAYADTLREQGFSEYRITQLVSRRASYYHRQRAMNIARTELSYIYQRGQLEAIKSLTLPNMPLYGKTILKIWSSASDYRVCARCEQLDGRVVELMEDFKAEGRHEIYAPAPPLHPCCRCAIIYRIEGLRK